MQYLRRFKRCNLEKRSSITNALLECKTCIVRVLTIVLTDGEPQPLAQAKAYVSACFVWTGAKTVELNTRGRYAVMAMADLSKYGVERAVSLSEIAQRQHLSEAYLGQIFAELRQARLVESVRGRGGGYKLARPAKNIMVGDVMAAVEEHTHMTRCIMDGHDGHIGCVDEKRCLTHGLWTALGRHIETFLANVSLHDVVENGPQLRTPIAFCAEWRKGEEIAAE